MKPQDMPLTERLAIPILKFEWDATYPASVKREIERLVTQHYTTILEACFLCKYFKTKKAIDALIELALESPENTSIEEYTLWIHVTYEPTAKFRIELIEGGVEGETIAFIQLKPFAPYGIQDDEEVKRLLKEALGERDFEE